MLSHINTVLVSNIALLATTNTLQVFTTNLLVITTTLLVINTTLLVLMCNALHLLLLISRCYYDTRFSESRINSLCLVAVHSDGAQCMTCCMNMITLTVRLFYFNFEVHIAIVTDK